MDLLIVAVAVPAGFAFGAWRALRRGGGVADALQWGVGHAVAALVAALVVSILLGLLGMGTR